jgi:hypothetical protein
MAAWLKIVVSPVLFRVGIPLASTSRVYGDDMRMILAMACISVALVVPSAGQAAVTVGELADSTSQTCDGSGNNLIQADSAPGSKSFAMPSKGVITSWSHRSAGVAGSKLQLKVFRPEGDDKFKNVGQSEFRRVDERGIVHSRTHIRVRAGDVLGLGLATNADEAPTSCFDPDGDSGDAEFARSKNLKPGESGTFPAGPFPVRLNVSAKLEKKSSRGAALRSSYWPASSATSP